MISKRLDKLIMGVVVIWFMLGSLQRWAIEPKEKQWGTKEPLEATPVLEL